MSLGDTRNHMTQWLSHCNKPARLMGSRIPLTLSVKKLTATVGGQGENYRSSSAREALRRRPDPFGLLATDLRQNVLARQRLKKRRLTNTSSPTRTFGFSAKATPLIARPNLTKRRGKRRRRGRILWGTVVLVHSISKVGGRIGEDRGE